MIVKLLQIIIYLSDNYSFGHVKMTLGIVVRLPSTLASIVSEELHSFLAINELFSVTKLIF